MNRNKGITLLMVAVAGLSLSACSSNNSSKSNSETHKSSQVSKKKHRQTAKEIMQSAEAKENRKTEKYIARSKKEAQGLADAINKQATYFKMTYTKDGEAGVLTDKANTKDVQSAPAKATDISSFAKVNKLDKIQTSGLKDLFSNYTAPQNVKLSYLYAKLQNAKLEKQDGFYGISAKVTYYEKDTTTGASTTPANSSIIFNQDDFELENVK